MGKVYDKIFIFNLIFYLTYTILFMILPVNLELSKDFNYIPVLEQGLWQMEPANKYYRIPALREIVVDLYILNS